jgi:hypothetical protein
MGFNKADTTSSTITLVAGERDEAGNVKHLGHIDASNSGVVGQNVKMEATGSIKGLVVAKHNIDLAARENVNITAMAQGNVSVNAGGSVSGTVVSLGSVQTTGASIDAALMSTDVRTTGDASSADVGFQQTAVASATSQSAQSQNSMEERKKAASAPTDEDDEKRRKPSTGLLARGRSRVTVVLPNRL